MKKLIKTLKTSFSAHNFFELFFGLILAWLVLIIVYQLGIFIYKLCEMWAAEIIKYIYA